MHQFTSLNDLTSSELLELLCFIQGMKVEQEEFVNFYEGLSDIQKSIWVNTDIEERQIRDIVEKFLLVSEKESLTQLYKLSEKRLGEIRSSLENIKIDIRFKKFGQYIFQTDIQTLPIKIKQLDLGDIDKISEVSLSDLEKQLNEVEFKIAQKGAVKAKADLKLRNVPRITAVKGQIAARIRDFTDVVGANLQTKLKSEILAGIKAGEGTSDIAKRIRGVYKKPVPIEVKPLIRDGKQIRAGYSYSISNKRWSEMVARSESSWSVNQGRVEAYKSSGLVRNVTWQTAANPCPDCAIMEGQVLELYEAENMIPYHVHCLTSDKTKIYTVEGYKQFKHLKNSDYVLTHKGKFRKIKKILKNDRYNLDVYTFIIKNDGFSDRTGQYKLTVTYDHPILTSNGWKSAKDITYEDKIIMLGSKCKYCGKIFVGSNHECCSFSHTAKYKVTNQWKKLRKKMLKALRSVKWSEERKENSKRILKKARNKLKKEHRLGFQNKQVQDKAQKTININTKNRRLRGFQIKHVRDAAFKSLGKLQISSLEVLLYQYLKELGIKNIKKQFNIGNYYVDLYLPKYNLALEADGYYHRFSKLRDKKRDIEIKKQGHDILRLNSSVIQDENHCKTILTNILKNHANQFIFVEPSIARIQKKFKKHQTSFNLEVEEDESFIAKDFVVHNCKCTWTVNAYKSVDEKLPEPPTQFSDELYDKPSGVGITGIMKMSPGDERIFDRALELGNVKQAEKIMRHHHTTSKKIRDLQFKPGTAEVEWTSTTSPSVGVAAGEISYGSAFSDKEVSFLKDVVHSLPEKVRRESSLRAILKGSESEWAKVVPRGFSRTAYGMAANVQSGYVKLYGNILEHKHFIKQNVIHEWAHIKDASMHKYSRDITYKTIVSKEGWVSAYSKKRALFNEDFAESVMLYVNHPKTFQAGWPDHYKYIDKIFKTMKHILMFDIRKSSDNLILQENYFDNDRKLVDKKQASYAEYAYYTKEKDYVKSIVEFIKK